MVFNNVDPFSSQLFVNNAMMLSSIVYFFIGSVSGHSLQKFALPVCSSSVTTLIFFRFNFCSIILRCFCRLSRGDLFYENFLN